MAAGSEAKSFHFDCMKAVATKDPKISKLTKGTLRKAMGLTKSQREVLDGILDGSVTTGVGSSPMKSKKCPADEEDAPPSKKAKLDSPAKAKATPLKPASPAKVIKATSTKVAAKAKAAAVGRFSDVMADNLDGLGPIVGIMSAPALPLQQAAIQTKVPDMDACSFLAAENGIKLAEKGGLTADEAGSLNLYTMESKLYQTLNARLRDRDRSKLKVFFPLLRHMLKARAKLPKFKGTVWRGVKADLSGSYPKGKELYWWAFSSTTKELSTLNNPMFLGTKGVRTVFNIQVSSGVDIRKYSVYQGENSEAEVLLFPGTKLKVIDSMDMGHGLHQVHLKEVTLPTPLMK